MAAPARKTVELFYDVISPYTWFAFEVLCRYKTRWNIDVKLKPFFLGGIMHATGNKAPLTVPNKAAYMPKELELLSKYFEVPLTQPTDEDISRPESFIQAGKNIGMSDDQVRKTVGMIKDQAVKDQLKKHTEEALSYGSFGSPTIIAHVDKPVMLFGSDRFPILAQILGEKWEGPVPGHGSKL